MNTHHGAHHLHGHPHQAATPSPARLDLASLHGARSGPTPSVAAPSAAREVHVTLEARETSWEIAPGHTVSAWGYQGTVPGPTIVAHVGDTLVAHLVNRLPEPTVIHWHGLRVPAAMDGTDSVQTVVQPGESFEYRFTLPDAGTFWYHSHANETVQIERGLYGALMVLGPDEPRLRRGSRAGARRRQARSQGADREDGALRSATAGARARSPLINGRSQPELEIAAGQIERWRIVNACSSRYVRLSLGGRPFRVIGGDGGLRDERGHGDGDAAHPRRSRRARGRSLRATKARRSRSSRCRTGAPS